MSAPHRARPGAPPALPPEPGFGWRGRDGRPRHAGIGSRADLERTADADADRHADDLDDERFGSADERYFGSADRHPGIGSAERYDDDQDDIGMPMDRHDGVQGGGIGSADDSADDSADGTADADAAGRPAGERRPLLDNLRFVNEDIASLRKLLLFARTAHYNLDHIQLVRGANMAFFWCFTAPLLTAAFFLIWAYCLRLHRALTAWGITLVAATALNPLADWLVPDGLDLTTWWPTGWQWFAGGACVFLVASALAPRIEQRAKRRRAGRAKQR